MKTRGPTLDEARRGIYLDFEGAVDESPAVLGTLWVSRQGQEPMLRQHVLDRALRAVVAPPLGSASLVGELRSLIGRAERQHRALIGWSGHELEVVRAHCPELAPAFEAVFRDARVPAKAWGRLTGLKLKKDERERTHRLSSYEAALGQARSEELGPKQMTKAIRGVRRELDRGAEVVSDHAMRRWQRMLEHNELDLRATRAVALRALEDLTAAEAVERARAEEPPRERRGAAKKAKRKHRKAA